MHLPITLNQDNAAQVLAELAPRLAATAPGSTAHLDAGALQRFDSCALAVLLALQRQARALGVGLHCDSLPTRLQDLARVYGLDGLVGDAA